MRKLIVLIALFVCANSYSQEYTVLHINSNWNYKALLEDQQPSIRQQIKAVPVIFIYKDRSLIGRWDADISLSIKAPVEELQSIIDKSKYTRIATND